MGFASAISSIAGGGLLGIGSAEASAKTQYRYNKRYLQKSPGWKMTGLRDAGINPMLAAGSLAGASPAAGMPNVPITGPEIVSSAKTKNAQAKVLKEQAKVASNQAVSSAADANMKTMQMNWESEVYNHMHSRSGGFLRNLASLKKAGYKGDMADAIAAGILLPDKNSAKTVAPPRKQYAPEYMGVPIWR